MKKGWVEVKEMGTFNRCAGFAVGRPGGERTLAV
jgi:hypothetical protein